ncbi:MAG: hypothetical protein WCG83_05370 [Candidatus Peregrinibacteria bacterium]
MDQKPFIEMVMALLSDTQPDIADALIAQSAKIPPEEREQITTELSKAGGLSQAALNEGSITLQSIIREMKKVARVRTEREDRAQEILPFPQKK